MGGKHRERQAIAQVACPECGAAKGAPCVDAQGRPHRGEGGRPIVHTARRHAWQAARPADPLEGADIIMAPGRQPDGREDTSVITLVPLTDRGRAALPKGLTRYAATEIRARLAALREQGLIIMREDNVLCAVARDEKERATR